MRVKILKEHGHQEAVCGMCLSYSELPEDIYEFDWRAKMDTVKKVAVKDGGHNKLLESILILLDIDAPIYWWQEFDTYRIGVTRQSESKMHTLMKRLLVQDDFQGGIEPVILQRVNEFITAKDFMGALRNLPVSFLQRRIVATNYKAVRGIVKQRKGHKLEEWKTLLEALDAGLSWSWALK